MHGSILTLMGFWTKYLLQTAAWSMPLMCHILTAWSLRDRGTNCLYHLAHKSSSCLVSRIQATGAWHGHWWLTVTKEILKWETCIQEEINLPQEPFLVNRDLLHLSRAHSLVHRHWDTSSGFPHCWPLAIWEVPWDQHSDIEKELGFFPPLYTWHPTRRMNYIILWKYMLSWQRFSGLSPTGIVGGSVPGTTIGHKNEASKFTHFYWLLGCRQWA